MWSRAHGHRRATPLGLARPELGTATSPDVGLDAGVGDPYMATILYGGRTDLNRRQSLRRQVGQLRGPSGEGAAGRAAGVDGNVRRLSCCSQISGAALP